ncbi:MAG: PDZ domain-containing protein, partial [Candidatus Magnetomorum sp.]|nr:PDZ domain-containing protein [Candidatus Magnetomorum sp.]
MDDLNGVQTISAEEKRLLALKNKIKWFTAVIVIAAIAIAGMLGINFYPELLRRLLGDQERGDLSSPLTYNTTTTTTSTNNLRKASATRTTVYLGIEIQDVSDTMAQALNLRTNNGVVITKITPSSPADVSGLLPGDIILRFDRERVKDTSDIQEVLKDEEPGDVVKVVVDRDGMTRVFYVELGSSVSSYLQKAALTTGTTTVLPQGTMQWGCTLSELTSDLQYRLSVPATIKGVVVVAVSAYGLAKSSGIVTGDVITEVNRQATPTLQTFYESIENQSVVVLEIFRSGRLTYIQIQTNNAIPPLATIAGSIDDTQLLPNRVAIAANGNTLDSLMAPLFGSAPYFIIVDLNTKRYSVVPNNTIAGAGTYGVAAVQLVVDQGATAVIAENYGPQIYQALIAAQLKMFRANPGKVSEALEQYSAYVLTQVSSPTTQGMARNVISTGGAPFASSEDDEEEEQSGYKGTPYTIPPQGKYDPALDPANAVQNTAGTTTLNQQTQYCYCPQCKVVYDHPLKVQCSSLSCNICGNRLINLSSGANTTQSTTGAAALASGVALQRRIAVASTGTTVNSSIAMLFGTAPYFLIFDIESNQYQVIRNPALTDTRSYGVIATQTLLAQNVGAVIAGSYGSRAYGALLALNITPYAYQGVVVNGVNEYRSGKLAPATDTSLPGFTYTQNIVPTGGAPFASDEDDEEEEQSGYKGMPYTIPPQGQYDPALDPANAPATTTDTQTFPVPQRVAVASTGNTINSLMAPVFRNAPYFLIVDIKTDQVTAVQNTYLLNPTVPTTIQPSQIVISQGVGATIAGIYGPVCYNALVANNVIPFTANPGTVSDILKLYKAASLIRVSSAAALPTQTQTQIQSSAMISVGGSPFTTAEDDEEEEQSGYKGMPYTLPPQGKYDPALDPANAAVQTTAPANTAVQTTAGSTQRTDYCYCPYCRILVPHPSSVPCSGLECPQCGNRLMNWDASGSTLQTSVPTSSLLQTPQYPVYSQIVSNTLGANTLDGATTYVQVPTLNQQYVPNTYTYPQSTTYTYPQSTTYTYPQSTTYTYPQSTTYTYPQSTYTQVPVQTTQNQLRTGSSSTLNSTGTLNLNLNQQTQYCYCPHCNVIYEHPPGVPCSSMTCPACGNRLLSLNGGAINQTQVYTISGQPATIPPMGQTAAGIAVAGQPTTLPPMGQTAAGIAVAGQPTTMGQTSAGIAVAGQPTTLPMGQTSAGIAVAGQPTTLPMGQTSAGIAVAGQPTTMG